MATRLTLSRCQGSISTFSSFAVAAILVAKDAGPVRIAALRSANPYLDFARAIELFHPLPRFTMEIHPTAVIAQTAKIAPGAHIGPYCFVDEDVSIGRSAVLHSFVTIYPGAKIGDDFFAHSHVTVRENCRIGDRVLLQNGVTRGRQSGKVGDCSPSHEGASGFGGEPQYV